MQSSVARTLDLSPFATRSAPSAAMMLYAVGYLIVGLCLALHRFDQRDL